MKFELKLTRREIGTTRQQVRSSPDKHVKTLVNLWMKVGKETKEFEVNYHGSKGVRRELELRTGLLKSNEVLEMIDNIKMKRKERNKVEIVRLPVHK